MPRMIGAWIRGMMLLAGAFTLILTPAMAQNSAPLAPTSQRRSIDLGFTWSPEHAKIAENACHCFWLQGLSANASLNFYRGLGIAVDLTQGSASNIEPGLDLKKITFAVGPRYTLDLAHFKRMKDSQHAPRLFGQALFGPSHAYNSFFPTPTGSTSSANSFSIQLGGGADLPLKRGFGLRLLEIDYVRTTFPNDYSNIQNDYRLGFGFSYRLKQSNPAHRARR